MEITQEIIDEMLEWREFCPMLDKLDKPIVSLLVRKCAMSLSDTELERLNNIPFIPESVFCGRRGSRVGDLINFDEPRTALADEIVNRCQIVFDKVLLLSLVTPFSLQDTMQDFLSGDILFVPSLKSE